MRFSDAFGITRTSSDDWFDPHLSIDTKLFLDPLLLLESGDEWKHGHAELIDHFVHCYRLVAKATSFQSVSGRAAIRLLTFPEPGEFGLGYTARSTHGSGSGEKHARHMADGIAVALAAGLGEPEHIEEVGIFHDGTGADRISDAVANVLKARFVEYTQSIARQHDVPLEPHRVKNARCNTGAGRWITESVLLPTNPAQGGPIVLTPERLLNVLPTLNATDWFESSLNSDIRGQMNLKVGERVRKKRIVEIARAHPHRVRQWAQDQTSRTDLEAYDFASDPLGVVQWDQEPVTYAEKNPIQASIVNSQRDLSNLVRQMLEHFRHFIEDQRGWSLLWNADGSEKPEEAAQLLFLGMAQHYLRLFNVEVDREVELGRGPVDFKAASGTSIRLLIEVKKAHNGKFWNGLTQQLPSYLKSDASTEGWYVAIQYRDKGTSKARLALLPGRVRALSQEQGREFRFVSIDARRPVSASNIEPDSGTGR